MSNFCLLLCLLDSEVIAAAAPPIQVQATLVTCIVPPLFALTSLSKHPSTYPHSPPAFISAAEKTNSVGARMASFRDNDAHFATKALHVGQEPEQWSSMAVVPPISMSTTFKQDAPADFKMYEYGRSGNPTRGVLEACLASLDGAKHACVFSSGLATSTTITHLLSAGDHVISMDDLYGGTNRYFRKVAARMNIETSFVDATNPKNIEAAIRPNTRMVWCESPTNPTLKVVDIKAVAEITKKHPNIFLVVDNTFLSCYFQRPLELGADIVMYSLTKYMNGHTDVIMGAACTSNDDLADRLRFLQNAIGPVPSPFDCYLVNRSELLNLKF